MTISSRKNFDSIEAIELDRRTFFAGLATCLVFSPEELEKFDSGKVIDIAIENTICEINDEFTRTMFTDAVSSYLKYDLKAKGAIYGYVVHCDEKNNTQDIIDANGFVADIYIKPRTTISPIPQEHQGKIPFHHYRYEVKQKKISLEEIRGMIES